MDRVELPNDVMLREVSRMLAEGHSVVILARGVSMLPFIVGDRDSVELVRKENYSSGDIALAQVAEGRWVLHRIVAVEGENITLKGDGNLKGTERCRMEDIAGSVKRILRPKSEVECGSARFAARSQRWSRLPYTVRRVILGILRRVI